MLLFLHVISVVDGNECRFLHDDLATLGTSCHAVPLHVTPARFDGYCTHGTLLSDSYASASGPDVGWFVLPYGGE